MMGKDFMNAELVERIKGAVGPRAYLDTSVLKTAILAAETALEYAALCHEDIDTACSHERENGDPGAGAIGAVVAYRDRIRALKA